MRSKPRNNLIEFRQKLGLTQTEMGALFNKKKGYWCFLELGKRDGDPDLWLDIGIKFNLTFQQVKKLREVSKWENTM